MGRPRGSSWGAVVVTAHFVETRPLVQPECRTEIHTVGIVCTDPICQRSEHTTSGALAPRVRQRGHAKHPPAVVGNRARDLHRVARPSRRAPNLGRARHPRGAGRAQAHLAADAAVGLRGRHPRARRKTTVVETEAASSSPRDKTAAVSIPRKNSPTSAPSMACDAPWADAPPATTTP